ncbi:MAG TPA: hypothetical protein VGF99_03920 [Myxococcota bacterium]
MARCSADRIGGGARTCAAPRHAVSTQASCGSFADVDRGAVASSSGAVSIAVDAAAAAAQPPRRPPP